MQIIKVNLHYKYQTRDSWKNNDCKIYSNTIAIQTKQLLWSTDLIQTNAPNGVLQENKRWPD